MKLRLIKDFRLTGAKFWVNLETMKMGGVQLFLTKNGTGVEHELIELDILQAIFYIENEFLQSEEKWDFCRNLFHQITKECFDYKVSTKA